MVTNFSNSKQTQQWKKLSKELHEMADLYVLGHLAPSDEKIFRIALKDNSSLRKYVEEYEEEIGSQPSTDLEEACRDVEDEQPHLMSMSPQSLIKLYESNTMNDDEKFAAENLFRTDPRFKGEYIIGLGTI